MTVRMNRRRIGALTAAAAGGALLTPQIASANPEHRHDHDHDGGTHTAPHDVTFIAMLLPHHEQAVQMASVAARRATRADVRRLAAHIATEQSRQIEQMQAWLHRRGENPMPPPEPVQQMDAQDLEMLREATGVQVDRLFLMMMRPHHAQGVSESEDELQHGRNHFAVNLARTNKRDQAQEIDQMNDLLADPP